MHGIYTYIPETNYVPKEYSVAAILLLLFMVLISLVSVLNLSYFYISTFRSMCAVPNMAVFCSSLTSWFPVMLLTYFLNVFEIVPVAPIITGITFVFTFHIRCISIVRSLHFRIFSTSFKITFLSPEIATSINIIMRVIKSRRMRWAGHVARMGEERGAYRVLVGKPEGKRPLGRPRRRWVDNIRMDLQEVGCGYVDWIGLAQDRDRWRTLVSAVMNLRVP